MSNGSLVTLPELEARIAAVRDPRCKALTGGHCVGTPADGGRIFSGAMDDASGVAAVLDIAHRLKKASHPPRRSILFIIFTAEEKGLLGPPQLETILLQDGLLKLGQHHLELEDRLLPPSFQAPDFMAAFPESRDQSAEGLLILFRQLC